MENFKGTKGKWESYDLNDGSGLHGIFSSKANTIVARTCYLPLSEANAQLIAHAPEMLEMLQSIVDKPAFKEYFPATRIEVLELIKKATTI